VELIENMCTPEGENMRSVTSVAIEEVRSGEWDSGGQALTTDAVQPSLAAFLGFGYGCF
jgi:hypothetical protein